MKNWKILALFFISLVMVFLLIEIVSPTWFLENWDRKKTITITENSGKDLMNYTVNISVDYDSDMMANFSDLRFVNSTDDGNLSFWIRNYTLSSRAEVWINIPNITANSNTVIYMYYKQILAERKSNVTLIMIGGDDFEENNTVLWTSNSSGKYNISEKPYLGSFALNITGNISVGDRVSLNYTSLKNTTDNYLIHFGFFPGLIGSEFVIAYFDSAIQKETAIQLQGNPVIGGRIYYMDSTCDYVDPSAPAFVADKWNDITIKINTTNKLQTIFINNKTVVNDATMCAWASPARYLYLSLDNSTWYFDDFYIRKYAETEPTYVTGTEIRSELSNPLITINSPLNQTYYSFNSDYDLTFDITSDKNLSFCNVTIDTFNRTMILNSTFTGGNYTNTSMTLTQHKAYFWCNDTYSKINNTESIIFAIDKYVFGLCNDTLITPYLNLSFKDESSNAVINATIDTSTWYFWTTSRSVNSSYSYSNTDQNISYTFCFFPSNENITIDSTIQYKRDGYIQRNMNYIDLILSNATTNKTLYLLGTGSGIYARYQAVSRASQPISSVLVEVERQISGLWENLTSGYTGDDGMFTVWVNPDYTHRLTFSKTGYDSLTITHTPTYEIYTVTLGSIAVYNVSDYSRGISYTVYPTNTTLRNNTDYKFQLDLVSDYWALDNFGFCLLNMSNQLGCNSSTIATGGTIIYHLNSDVYERITMKYYWYTNATNSTGYAYWSVRDIEGTGWSLKNFFADLKNYTNQNIFGLNEYSRTLLIFLFIFITVGMIAYVSGLYSPAAVSLMILALVAFFDVGLGMLTKTLSPFPYFTTIIIALISMGLLFREWYR